MEAMGAIATERNNSLYWELLHGLDDLESTTFREHWYYRSDLFAVNTNVAINPTRRWEHAHLMERARDFERGRNNV